MSVPSCEPSPIPARLDALTILLADDDEWCRFSLLHGLRRAHLGWHLEDASTPTQTIDAIRTGRFDVALVDPCFGNDEAAAFGLIRAIRKAAVHVTILILTDAPVQDEAMRAAFESGADDYVTKDTSAFGISVSIRKAILRSLAHSSNSRTLRSVWGRSLQDEPYGPFSVDVIDDDCGKVFFNGARLPALRGRSWKLFYYLFQNRGRFVAWNDIERQVFEAKVSRSARTTATNRLRKTLGEAGCYVRARNGTIGLVHRPLVSQPR